MATTNAETLVSTSLQETAQFPQELIDLFVEHVCCDLEAHKARSTLETLSRVSHSFSALSRKHLLSSILISEQPEVSALSGQERPAVEEAFRLRLLSLRALIESGSDFKSLIRKVHIQVLLLDDSSGLHWVIDSLRSNAKNLESLWITGNKVPLTCWPTNTQSTFRTLSNLVSSVKFRCLRLSHLRDIPINLLAKCPSLRSLHLALSTFRRRDNPIPLNLRSLPSKRIQLEEIEVHGSVSDFVVQLPQLGIGLSSLQRFHVLVLHNWDVTAAKSLIEEMKHSLVSLEVILHMKESRGPGGGVAHSFPTFDGDPIDIGRCPRLVNFKLRISTGAYNSSSFLSDAFSILDSLTHPTQLQTIEIAFESSAQARKGFHVLDHDDPAWTVLAPSHLREKHPLLESVHVNLKVELSWYAPPPWLTGTLKQILVSVLIDKFGSAFSPVILHSQTTLFLEKHQPVTLGK
ncbi:hypothetical protein GALMADRAFT_283774 [Galerina marginata CBS 339.88]|uniref:F-box domain-containing protein n=1 Tax=Galerina marginata (strain CBS 339.88) TaxID=685588 RepID=A0A067S787_GALM3|nr:hypothetical protein GALMADRAFT_283774 [Galerina marginata CBS 339.88]